MKSHSSLVSLLAGLCAAVALTASAHAQTALPKVGDKAPSFEGKDQDGKTFKLADSAGKSAVLLYFYPKDNTPGCRVEACGFRDHMETFKKEGVTVVGVSMDDAESHKKFIAAEKLNFDLLADTDGKLAGLFGTKMTDGRNMARRVSFLIDKEGKIAHVTDNSSANVHLTEMKDATAKLAKK